MQKEELTQEELAQLLREAEQAHAAYESTLGHRMRLANLVCNLYHQQITRTEGTLTMTVSLSYTHVLHH